MNRVATAFWIIAAVASLALILPPSPAWTEGPPLVNRPKVGLVLSGGGARGIAHIGILKVLERMRVPIDCIVGTSMGAIVGGLYAAGTSPEDLEDLVQSIPWNEAFKDKPATDQLSFRRKGESQAYRIDLNLGYGEGKVKTARGFVQGQNLNTLLKKLLLHTSNIKDFDKLRIPFRAVAADIETGDAVVLRSGDLAAAIRASMSIPGFFAPEEIEGKMLVDGGIANNLPINVAREMGADILIVVDIGTHLRGRTDLNSAASITAQVMTILIQRNVAAQVKTLHARDILIRPDLGNVGTTDFSQTQKALRIGQDAGAKVQERIAGLSVSAEGYRAYLKKQRHPPLELPIVDYVAVQQPNNNLSQNSLEAKIQTKAGKKLNLDTLDKDLNRLYGLDTFERVNFRLEEKDKKTGLIFEPVEKSWGPTSMRFALSWADNFQGESTYTIGASIVRTQLNSLGGEWRNQFQLGDRPRVFSELYQPLDLAAHYFIAPQVSYSEQNINLYRSQSKGDSIAQYRVKEAMAGLDMGREFGNWGEFRLGLRRGYGATRINIGPADLDSGSYNVGGLFSSFSYNTLDNFNFPLRGTTTDVAVLTTLQELGSDVKANSLTAGFLTAKTWDRITIIPSVSYAGVFEGSTQIQNAHSIGGFFNLSGYMPYELSGQYIGLGRIIAYRNMGNYGLGEMTAQLYLGFSAEAGNAWQERNDITLGSLIYAGSVFVGANTYIGPVYLLYGMAEGGHQAVGLLIGQRF